MALTIISMTLPTSKYSIKCPYYMTPTRIVVHNTANDASAKAEVSYMQGNNEYTGFHYAVDDYIAVQGIPLDRNAYHAGDGINGMGNRQGIGIEICYSKYGGIRFTNAERNGAILCAMVLKEKGWGMDRLTKHQDYSGKYCPHRTLDLGWMRFKAMVQDELNKLKGVTTIPSAPTVGPYVVKVTTAVLNIRSGAGTSYPVVDTITNMGAYTITQTLNGWGKLKSGAGWISLAYTKRV